MGYTHYWTHHRRFTNEEWAEAMMDVADILEQALKDGVAIGDGAGETPITERLSIFSDDRKEIMFNGVGEDCHETFCLYQNRRPLESWQTKDQHGGDFCKTARKPYDVAVTAILCYLESCWDGKFSASSDGDLEDWTAGLELARRALPRKVNMLQEPLAVRFEAQFVYRPDMPRVYGNTYSMRQHVSGRWCFIKGDRFNIIANVKPENAPAFEAKARTMLANVPTSGYMDELARKADRALRNLLTYCTNVELVNRGEPPELSL